MYVLRIQVRSVHFFRPADLT